MTEYIISFSANDSANLDGSPARNSRNSPGPLMVRPDVRTVLASIAALAARRLQRPVLVRLTRAQDMTMTGKRHPFFARFKVGFNREGRLCALLVDLFSDGG